MITTGEGGAMPTMMIVWISLLPRTHGIKDNTKFIDESHGSWYYEQQFRFNYRMTDIQAALISQLKRLISLRGRGANYYLNNCKMLDAYSAPDTNSSWHLFVIKLKMTDIRRFKETRNTNPSSLPSVNSQPYYKAEHLPQYKAFYEQC